MEGWVSGEEAFCFDGVEFELVVEGILFAYIKYDLHGWWI